MLPNFLSLVVQQEFFHNCVILALTNCDQGLVFYYLNIKYTEPISFSSIPIIEALMTDFHEQPL